MPTHPRPVLPTTGTDTAHLVHGEAPLDVASMYVEPTVALQRETVTPLSDLDPSDPSGPSDPEATQAAPWQAQGLDAPPAQESEDPAPLTPYVDDPERPLFADTHRREEPTASGASESTRPIASRPLTAVPATSISGSRVSAVVTRRRTTAESSTTSTRITADPSAAQAGS